MSGLEAASEGTLHHAFLLEFAESGGDATVRTPTVAAPEATPAGPTRAAAAAVAAAAAAVAAAEPASDEFRPPVTDSVLTFLSAAAAGSYRASADSSMPRSSVGQKRRPLARRPAASQTRGELYAYQLHNEQTGTGAGAGTTADTQTGREDEGNGTVSEGTIRSKPIQSAVLTAASRG